MKDRLEKFIKTEGYPDYFITGFQQSHSSNRAICTATHSKQYAFVFLYHAAKLRIFPYLCQLKPKRE